MWGSQTPDPQGTPAPAQRPVTDHRRWPAGVMPAHLQHWLMAGIALVMVAILALAGPPKPTTSATTTTQPPTAVGPNGQRIEDYQRRVQEQAQRLAAEQAALQVTKDARNRVPGVSPDLAGVPANLRATGPNPLAGVRGAEPFDAAADQPYGATDGVADASIPMSVTASGRVSDNVAYSRGREQTAQPAATPATTPAAHAFGSGIPGSAPAPGTSLALPPGFFNPVTTPIEPAPVPARRDGSGVPDAAATTRTPAAPESRDLHGSPSAEPRLRLREGTVIDAVLTNRLDGSFQAPVNALVSVPVYVGDQVVIPAGARVLGEAKPVNAFGQTRLAVAFHRVQLPGGDRIDLDAVPALNQAGDLGLRDQVDRHYGEMFGASIALGLLAGFTQGQTPVGFDATADDRYRQGIASSIGQSGTRMLDRVLNLMPTVTIREGHRLKVYLSRDLDLLPYRPPSPRGLTNPVPTVPGGAR
jgi:type IV secretion system protein TrbI